MTDETAAAVEDEPTAFDTVERFAVSGRVVLITGAAHGLGLAMASAFVGAGAKVTLVDHDEDALGRAGARVSARGDAIAARCDLRDDAAIEGAVQAAHDAFGRLDVVVNNAGIYPTAALADMDRPAILEVLDVNAAAGARLAAAAHDHLIAHGSGRIINIASIEFYRGSPLLGAYAASKGAVIGLTRTLARELGPHGVTANAIAPGAFPTRADTLDGDPDDWPGFVLAAQSIKRRGAVGDVAAAALFLASDAASFITGQTITVDGGWVFH